MSSAEDRDDAHELRHPDALMMGHRPAARTIDDVRSFWESKPLWTGESGHAAGTREFFEEHRRVVIEDAFAGQLDPRVLPGPGHRTRVLDLGCGPGFWTVEL